MEGRHRSVPYGAPLSVCPFAPLSSPTLISSFFLWLPVLFCLYLGLAMTALWPSKLKHLPSPGAKQFYLIRSWDGQVHCWHHFSESIRAEPCCLRTHCYCPEPGAAHDLQEARLQWGRPSTGAGSPLWKAEYVLWVQGSRGVMKQEPSCSSNQGKNYPIDVHRGQWWQIGLWTELKDQLGVSPTDVCH